MQFGPETLLGAILLSQGVEVYRKPPSAKGDWRSWNGADHDVFERELSKLLAKMNSFVFIVDNKKTHFHIDNVDQAARLKEKMSIEYVMVVMKETYHRCRGTIPFVTLPS